MTTEAITLSKPIEIKNGAFEDVALFEQAQRMAKCICTSTMVPDHYRGDANIGNVVIALDISYRLGLPVMMVMQNLYVVQGKPAWSGQMVLALINASGRFDQPVEFNMVGEQGKDTWGCRIEALPNGAKAAILGPTVTIAMAKAEGWYEKNGSKWKTMPEMMLRYRAASFFGRTKCPELLLGLQEQNEVLDSGPTIEVKAKPDLSTPQLVGLEPVK